MRSATLLVTMLLGCGDGGGGECTGVDDEAVGPLTITAGGTTLSYQGLVWGENNDCPAQGSPVVSVTISGPQVGPAPSDRGIAFCLPRPEVIGGTPISLADRALVELVGASGEADGCVFEPAFGAMPSGTIAFAGFCTAAGARFNLTLAGTIAGTRTCASEPPESVTLTLAGTTLVTPR